MTTVTSSGSRKGIRTTRAGSKTKVGSKVTGSAKKAVAGSALTRAAKKSASLTIGEKKKLSPPRFSDFIRQEPTTGESLIKKLRAGYPVELLKSAGEFFDIAESHVFKVVKVSGSTIHRYQKSGKPLDQAASERIHRLAIITRESIEVFGGREHATRWMRLPNLSLGNEAPIDLMDTEIGATAVRRVLNAIAEGGVV